MFNKISKLFVVMVTALTLSGCGAFDIAVAPSETAYLYKTDIYDSTRYNPGSDYEMSAPYATDYQLLKIDYGTTTTKFNIDYTLRDKKNKTRVLSTAFITYRLVRNENDTSELQFKDDLNAQYYTKNIKAVAASRGIYVISPEAVFKRLMNETLDKSFRQEFTNQTLYPDFNAIEGNVEQIRDRIKKELTLSARDVKIEIVGLSISSPTVPLPIQESRDNMLKLQQDALNNATELKIKSDMAAGRMAVEARQAINDVVLDRITTGNVNMSYLLIKTFNRAIDEKAPLNLTITPDLMRYLESDGKKNSSGKNDMFSTLNNMSNKQLQEYFAR